MEGVRVLHVQSLPARPSRVADLPRFPRPGLDTSASNKRSQRNWRNHCRGPPGAPAPGGLGTRRPRGNTAPTALRTNRVNGGPCTASERELDELRRALVRRVQSHPDRGWYAARRYLIRWSQNVVWEWIRSRLKARRLPCLYRLAADGSLPAEILADHVVCPRRDIDARENDGHGCCDGRQDCAVEAKPARPLGFANSHPVQASITKAAALGVRDRLLEVPGYDYVESAITQNVEERQIQDSCQALFLV